MNDKNDKLNGFFGLVILILAIIPWGTIFMAEEAIKAGGFLGAQDTWQGDLAEYGIDFMDSSVGDLVYEIPVEVAEEVVSDDMSGKEAMAIVGVFTFIQGVVVLWAIYIAFGVLPGWRQREETVQPPTPDSGLDML